MKSFLLPPALLAAAFLSSCSTPGQSLGTAPSHPVSSDTGLANTGASNPDPGISSKPVKIDTGIKPYADKKVASDRD